MKRTVRLALLVVALVVPAVMIAAAKAPRGEAGRDCCAPNDPDTLATAELDLRGMQSFLCALDVQAALESLDGVSAAAVDREAARATVTYDAAIASPEAMIVAVNARGYQASLAAAAEPAVASAGGGQDSHPVAPSRLTPQEIERVAGFAAEHILANGENPTRQAVEEATGVAVSQADAPILLQAVLARLAKDPRGQALLEGSRCSDYGACSLWGNLNTATGELLAMYEREKAADGTAYESLALPAFEARDLAGRTVRSTDLAGRPALVAFLAVHCNHSMDTFPILQELRRRFGAEELQVVGVLVNSGSVEDVNAWVQRFAPEFPVWVFEDASLGDLVDSHLVPTYLLIDEAGNVRKKLVGFKSQEAVLAALAAIGSAGPAAAGDELGRYMNPSCSFAASVIMPGFQGGSKTTSTCTSPTPSTSSTRRRTSSASTGPMPQPGAVSVIWMSTRWRPSGRAPKRQS